MDQTSAAQTAPEFEVLTDEELAAVIGGDVYETVTNTTNYVFSKLGGCGCAASH